MQQQGSFSQAEYVGKKKETRRDKFLAVMDVVVPWARLVERLRPLYPKGERGWPPIGLERMLRIYFLQQWYGLADEALEDALYDSQALRGFAGIELNRDPVPDATTLLKFRHWLERHDLTRALFEEVGWDCQEFRAEVGHDRSKGARQCRDAKNLAFPTPFSTSCWPVPIPRRFSIPTG